MFKDTLKQTLLTFLEGFPIDVGQIVYNDDEIPPSYSVEFLIQTKEGITPFTNITFLIEKEHFLFEDGNRLERDLLIETLFKDLLTVMETY